MGHISYVRVTETVVPGGWDDNGLWDEYTETRTTRVTAYYCDRCGSWLIARLQPEAETIHREMGKQADLERELAGKKGGGRASGCAAFWLAVVVLGTVLAVVYALYAGWRPVSIAVVVGIALVALYVTLSQVEDEKNRSSENQREAREEADSMWNIMHRDEIEARIKERTRYHCQNCGHEWHADDPKQPNTRGYTEQQYNAWKSSVAMKDAPFLFVESEMVDIQRG